MLYTVCERKTAKKSVLYPGALQLYLNTHFYMRVKDTITQGKAWNHFVYNSLSPTLSSMTHRQSFTGNTRKAALSVFRHHLEEWSICRGIYITLFSFLILVKWLNMLFITCKICTLQKSQNMKKLHLNTTQFKWNARQVVCHLECLVNSH